MYLNEFNFQDIKKIQKQKNFHEFFSLVFNFAILRIQYYDRNFHSTAFQNQGGGRLPCASQNYKLKENRRLQLTCCSVCPK